MVQTFFEFFAGGGMARLGLGSEWRCLLANDFDRKKVETYIANFGASEIICKDIYDMTCSDMIGSPTLAWASFPCQDLSLAGNRNGLAGERSGAFWGFWAAIHKLKVERRGPALLVLENVCGTLTSNDGKDFREICRALASLGYSFGAIIVDAVRFVPQSRPRLFIICVDDTKHLPPTLVSDRPTGGWSTVALSEAVDKLPRDLASKWKWWNLPEPQREVRGLGEIIEDAQESLLWHSKSETTKLIDMMSGTNREKVHSARKSGLRHVGTIYKRTRIEGGLRVQRAEVRFDGVAGCLRTPGGGSSRQTILVVNGDDVKSRLLTVREAARLMGVPETYKIPKNYNDGYHIFGDGLVVPAVAFLREHLLDEIVKPRFVAKNALNIAAE